MGLDSHDTSDSSSIGSECVVPSSQHPLDMVMPVTRLRFCGVHPELTEEEEQEGEQVKGEGKEDTPMVDLDDDYDGIDHTGSGSHFQWMMSTAVSRLRGFIFFMLQSISCFQGTFGHLTPYSDTLSILGIFRSVFMRIAGSPVNGLPCENLPNVLSFDWQT